ncbi:hypothetical protein [Ornithinimicrobium kibberense]|uniref:hypothetical protein n=1 Tax=Ornithinimicrobium kibberense TaxID=282060 RepID=UPI00360CBE90
MDRRRSTSSQPATIENRPRLHPRRLLPLLCGTDLEPDPATLASQRIEAAWSDCVVEGRILRMTATRPLMPHPVSGQAARMTFSARGQQPGPPRPRCRRRAPSACGFPR